MAHIKASFVVLAGLLIACSSSHTKDDDGPTDGTDSGADAEANEPVECGAIGQACSDDMSCADGVCQEELEGVLMVSGLPSGDPEIRSAIFPGNVCAPAGLTSISDTGGGACDPFAARTEQGCGPCGVCDEFFSADATNVICRQACTPSATTSGCDREDYTCDFFIHACTEACQSDAECRLVEEDTSVPPDGIADLLAYDDASTAVCDAVLGRCTNPAPEQAAGSPCSKDSECGGEAFCISPSLWPGGYCTKIGCEIEGRACVGQGSVCYDAGYASLICTQGCEVGQEPAQDQLGNQGHGLGCREGYLCAWNGDASISGTPNGGCFLGNYNDVTENNVGAACSTDTDCYSPFGYGQCISAEGWFFAPPYPTTGYCTISNCGASGLPTDLCGQSPEGANNQCAPLAGNLRICLESCASPEECEPGYGCLDYDAREETSKVCFPSCTNDADCRSSQTCHNAEALGGGLCIDR